MPATWGDPTCSQDRPGRTNKRTPNQDPRHTVGRATVVIVAEWKLPSPAIATRGLSLFTSSVRCTPADMFDMRLNSHSRLNLITALLQAIQAGAARPSDIFRHHQCQPQCAKCVCDMRRMIQDSREALRYAAE